jgi:hypothetical protein
VHRRLICCVLAIEIAEHDQRGLFDQIRVTEDLRRVIADAAAAVPAQDLIPIAREDGAVLAFVADVAACFASALAVREACLTQQRYRDMQPRIGIDLGPVEVLEDELGQAFLGGEGRRDAERLMRQGPPCQISVSRSFFELLARAAPDLAAQLKYQGLLTDTIGRPLGWYSLDPALERGPSPHGERDPDAQARPGKAASRSAQERRAPGNLRLSLHYALLPLLAVGAALVPLRELHAPAPAGLPADAIPTMEAVSAPLPRPATPIALKEDGLAPRTDAAPLPRLPAGTRKSAPRPPRSAPGASAQQALPAARVEPNAAAGAPATNVRTPAPAAAHAPGDLSSEASASVRLAVRPWGEVTVDGRRVGITPPLKVLQLRPGKHVIAISNGTLPAYRRELAVHPDLAPITLAHDFGCVAVRDLQCPEAIGTPVLASTRYRPKTTRDRTASPLLIFGRAGGQDPGGIAASTAPAGEDAVAAR